MKKGLILGVMVVAALFLFGCQQQEGPVAGPTFVGGTQALSMQFVEDAPPEEIFDGGNFPFAINVRMKNVGEWEIPAGADIRVKITGIDPAEYGVSPASLEKNPPQGMRSTRRGADGEIIEGDTLVMDFTGLNFQRTLYGNIDTTLKAEACYTYGTKFASNICIKEDLSSSDSSICTVNEAKAVSNSGAPVHISSMRESQSGSQSVLLTFTLRHVGTGEIFEKGSQCSDDLVKENRVYLKVDTGMPGLQCQLQNQAGQPLTGSEGYVTLYGGERQISCTQTTGGQGDFTKTVSATLEYDYEQFITKQITVKHIEN